MQQETAHRIRRAAAVLEHLGDTRIALLRHILRKSVEQVAEQRDRKLMFPNDFCDFEEERVAGRLELPAVVVQLTQAYFRRIVSLVGKIVRSAGKAVNDVDRLAQRRRYEQRRHGEVLVMAERHRWL